MVVFTCNNCGETLQKPRVTKHYQFQCRTAPFLTCVDCFKDFRGEEYAAHTKCITEAERYGGKNYVPKAGANKGERKQQEWLNVVNNLLNNSMDLSPAERSFLNTLTKFDNIPRKKAKFMNFVRSALGNRTNVHLIESVWNRMEAAQKNNIESTVEQQQPENGNADGKNIHDTVTDKDHHENNIAENQNNENIFKETQDKEQQNECDESLITNDSDDRTNKAKKAKKEKSKKREHSEDVEKQIEEPVSKKKRKDKNKSVLLESSVNQCEQTAEGQTVNGVEIQSFDWKNVILNIVQSKGEISLRKLQKRVINQYMNSYPDTLSYEKVSSKFNKKLKKIAEIVVSEDKVKLV